MCDVWMCCVLCRDQVPTWGEMQHTEFDHVMQRADYYSFAIISHEILYQKQPFHITNRDYTHRQKLVEIIKGIHTHTHIYTTHCILHTHSLPSLTYTTSTTILHPPPPTTLQRYNGRVVKLQQLEFWFSKSISPPLRLLWGHLPCRL